MNRFERARACAFHVFGIAISGGVMASLCLSAANAAQAGTPAAAAADTTAWGATISSTPLPGEGCFTAAYPSTTWSQVACTTAPPRRYGPAHGSPGFTVGDGNDFAATVLGYISSSVGSFPSITGLRKEEGEGTPNEYSLQLNSNFFSSSPACKHAAVPASCLAWEQFVYAQQGTADGDGELFMQYWLINYGASCPSGWFAFDADCYTNSNAVLVPPQVIKQLGGLKLSGTAITKGLDTIVLTTQRHAYSVTGQDSVVDLAKFWNASEFNIFGDGDGSEAEFNAGPSITVNIAVQNGKTKAPTCHSGAGTTGETNNLTLGTCSATGGSTPSIEFTESN